MATAASCNKFFLQLYGKCTASGENGRPEYYIFMEYFAGSNLCKILRNTVFELPVVQYVLLQYAEALEFLQSKQIIHRDLKPMNTLMDQESGRIKLIDFGLAVVGGQARGPEVDVYALGAIIYYMMFDRMTPQRFLEYEWVLTQKEANSNIINGVIEYPLDAGEETIELLDSLMHKDPQKRLKPHEIRNHQFVKSEKVSFVIECGILHFIRDRADAI